MTASPNPARTHALDAPSFRAIVQAGVSIGIDDPRLLPEFWSRVSPCPMSGCWLWTGSMTSGGFPHFLYRGGKFLAHRLALEVATGAIPRGLQIERSRRVIYCMNPAHARVRDVVVRQAIATGQGHQSSEYRTWAAMWQRCDNPKNTNYPLYGARGIRVCDSWLTFNGFYADMGPRPKGMSLDRIDNDGNYEPSNCRWATTLEQIRNRRATRLTPEIVRAIRKRKAHGEASRAIAREMGIAYRTIQDAIQGVTWSEVA